MFQNIKKNAFFQQHFYEQQKNLGINCGPWFIFYCKGKQD